MTAHGDGRLQSIQVLRAMAAFMVVWHHAIVAVTMSQSPMFEGFSPTMMGAAWFREGLASGVDIFFVISGFIMVVGADRYRSGVDSPWDFLRRRLFRIYPPYWVATALLLLLHVLLFGLASGVASETSLQRLAASLLLYPSYAPNGTVQPILGVGWTLSYEVYFYLALFAALWVRNHGWLTALAVGLAIPFMLARQSEGGSAALAFLRNPIIIEFLFGVALGWWARQGRRPAAVWLWLILPCLVALFAGAAANLAGLVGQDLRFLYWGLPAFGLVFGMLALSPGNSLLWRGLVALGDASYSLYLSHIPIVFFIAPALVRAANLYGLEPTQTTSVAIGVSLSIVVGFAFYIYAELPLQRLARRWETGWRI